MVDKNIFLQFICEKFRDDQLYIDKFKPEPWFLDVDCFPNKPYKLSISISEEDIKISTTDKEPVLDFFLYDYIFEENKDAELFIEKVLKKGSFF